MDWNFFLKVIGSLAIALLIFVGIVYVVGVPKELKSKAEVQVAEGLGEGAIKDALQDQVKKVPEGDLSSVPLVGDVQQKGPSGASGLPQKVGQGAGDTTKGLGQSAGGLTSGLGDRTGNSAKALGDGVKGVGEGVGGLTGGLIGNQK